MGTVMQQRTPSYDIGFTTGGKVCRANKRPHAQQQRSASSSTQLFGTASRAMSVERAAFEHGWQGGYQAYFDGII
jgi:hypothetical protein